MMIEAERMDLEELKNKILQYNMDNGIGVSEFARRCKLNNWVIYQLLSGKTHPTLETKTKIMTLIDKDEERIPIDDNIVQLKRNLTKLLRIRGKGSLGLEYCAGVQIGVLNALHDHRTIQTVKKSWLDGICSYIGLTFEELIEPEITESMIEKFNKIEIVEQKLVKKPRAKKIKPVVKKRGGNYKGHWFLVNPKKCAKCKYRNGSKEPVKVGTCNHFDITGKLKPKGADWDYCPSYEEGRRLKVNFINGTIRETEGI